MKKPCNPVKIVMPWLRDSQVISILSHLLLLTKQLQAHCRRQPHLYYTDLDTTYSRANLDITSYTSALALSGAEILRVLQSRAGLREKTTYRSAPSWIWWWWSEGVPHALWKATGGATSKVVRRRLTGRGQA